MGTSPEIRRGGLPLVLAVIAAVGFSGFGLIYAAATGNRMAVPGAAVATVLYLVLGGLAIRGQDWARWVFFSLICLTALSCLFFTFVDLGGPRPRLDFTPGLALLSMFYVVIAIGTASPAPRKRIRESG